jgi:hypothetical protein
MCVKQYTATFGDSDFKRVIMTAYPVLYIHHSGPSTHLTIHTQCTFPYIISSCMGLKGTATHLEKQNRPKAKNRMNRKWEITQHTAPSANLHEWFYLSIYSPSGGPWQLFQFLDLHTAGRTPWTGDRLVTRPLPRHRKP